MKKEEAGEKGDEGERERNLLCKVAFKVARGEDGKAGGERKPGGEGLKSDQEKNTKK